jgi:metallo-beta-lactamase family protein
VFVVHGEESSAVSFAELVTKELGIPAVAPYTGDVYDLISGQCVAVGDRKKAEHRADKGKNASNTVFDRLVAAGARLVAVIQKCKGMANKDLGKFADQINALADKWDR